MTRGDSYLGPRSESCCSQRGRWGEDKYGATPLLGTITHVLCLELVRCGAVLPTLPLRDFDYERQLVSWTMITPGFVPQKVCYCI